jgi:hypothetical protein
MDAATESLRGPLRRAGAAADEALDLGEAGGC